MDRETVRENDSEPRRRQSSDKAKRNPRDQRVAPGQSPDNMTERAPLTAREREERWPVG